MVCPSCDLQVLELRAGSAAQAKAKQYGVSRVPAVVVDGRLAACCLGGPVDAAMLRSLGVGVP